ncbi:hypothetical protein Tco_0157898 [Tanacetum coccineum]
MVINPPWNLPFLGAKGLTSPEQTATGKGISNPLMAVMVCQKPYGIQLQCYLRLSEKLKWVFQLTMDKHLSGGPKDDYPEFNGVNTPGSDENRLKLYDLMYKIVNVADIMDC